MQIYEIIFNFPNNYSSAGSSGWGALSSIPNMVIKVATAPPTICSTILGEITTENAPKTVIIWRIAPSNWEVV